MALEDKVAQLSQNVGNLVNLVSTQADRWNNAVQNEIANLEQWKQNAIKGYPAWNLFSNARLDKTNDDNSPKGIAWYNKNASITATVTKETNDGHWQTQGNFLRLTFKVDDTSKSSAYCGLFPSITPMYSTNAPIQPITAGFEYRVVSTAGNVSALVGGEYDNNYQLLDLTKTSWTQVSVTIYNAMKSIGWFYLNESSATLTIDLRNIYLNLGVANYYTLGIPQLTDLSI
jgi:hypothetical protein